MVECQLPKLKVAGSTPVSRSNHPSTARLARRHQRYAPVVHSDNPDGLTSIGRTIAINGEVTAGEHLIIEGSVRGKVIAPSHDVAVARRASVVADISAKTITVLGRASGKLIATDTLRIAPGGVVEGHVEAPEVELADGARIGLPSPGGRIKGASVGTIAPPRHAPRE